jgi:hypothetical protein
MLARPTCEVQYSAGKTPVVDAAAGSADSAGAVEVLGFAGVVAAAAAEVDGASVAGAGCSVVVFCSAMENPLWN